MSCALQGFNFLSAFLYSKKEVQDWGPFFKKELPKVLIPGVVAFFYVLALDSLVYLFFPPYSWANWLLSFQGHTLGGFWVIQFGNMYYCFVIAILYLALPLFQLSLNHRWLKILLIAIAIIELFLPFFLSEPICYAPFCLGYYYGRHFYDSDLGISPQKGPRFSSWLPFLLLLLFVFGNDAGRLWGNVNQTFLGFLLSFSNVTCKTGIGVTLVVLLIRFFRFLPSGFLRGFFHWSDRLSYPFFLTHFAFFMGALSLQGYLQNFLFSVPLIFLATLVSAFLVDLLSRPLLGLFHKPQPQKLA